ncbi:VAN3-binding protein-like [Zingiber officinale]|uniref:VAN3-binding protein-like n=1 Tax=Zingiber officinale TaxID=94328 RepID=A0A8J5KYH6_ZINOF|nr:VAN3-binding protein-like [Zingiber officinale]KAG6495310.1 hypothetical protein ZIOFF_043104 [Zingiber officinale]
MELKALPTIAMASDESMDLLSRAWCSSAIQVFQPSVDDSSSAFKERQIVSFEKERTIMPLPNGRSLNIDEGVFDTMPKVNYDDVKSWIWLQKSIHPELDYDVCMRKKWYSKNMIPWKGVSIRKWLKEVKQIRKEEERLHKAEVHAAVSVAGLAAALAAIAAENLDAAQHKSVKDKAVASAAALVAAQCAQIAEATGAKQEQISSAISEAVASSDPTDILTLTAATATSLRGAATLRGRHGHIEKPNETSQTQHSNEFGFEFGRCRASLAKGDEILVVTENGKKRRFRSVSAILNREGKVILRIKKINLLMIFSPGKESVVNELETNPIEEPEMGADGSYCISMQTSQGKIELKIYDYVQYKKWITTMNHMLMLSSTLSRKNLHLMRRD